MDDVTGDSFTLQDLACAIPPKCSIERVPDLSSMKSSDEDSNLLGSDGLPVRFERRVDSAEASLFGSVLRHHRDWDEKSIQ